MTPFRHMQHNRRYYLVCKFKLLDPRQTESFAFEAIMQESVH